jgi:hypothetical protein
MATSGVLAGATGDATNGQSARDKASRVAASLRIGGEQP